VDIDDLLVAQAGFNAIARQALKPRISKDGCAGGF
jgi:hypothetical protein